jgi:hypothetical protein
MNPRNIGAPGKETSIVDDFPVEERVLDSPIELSEMFPPESPKTRAVPRTPLLDLAEFPLRQSRPVTSVPATRPRPRRSFVRFVSKTGVVVISIVVALIAGAAVRNRLDVSSVSGYLAVSLSNYLPAIQNHLPAFQVAKPTAPDVSTPPAEVAPDSAATASTTGTTESRPATKSSLPAQRPPASSPRSGTPAGRAPATPRSLPTIERRPESSSRRVVAETISSPPVAAVSTSPPVAVVSSPPPVPAVSTSPAVAVVSSPPPVPAASSASPAATVSSAPAVSPPSPAPSPPAPVSAPSATPVSAPSATQAGGLTAETRAVAVALNRYQDAFSSLDANAAHAVWPSVDVRALAKAFGQLEEQTFDLEGCNITVAGAQAEADCAGNARYIPKVGNRTLRVEPRRWHFKLRQTNDQWFIDAVDAR